VLPQVETGAAVDNIDAILDVEGVGGIYVGPSDLGLSMGLPAILDREEPVILAIYEKLLAACGRRGLVPGIHCASPAYGRRMIAMGFRLVTVAADGALLARGAADAVKAMKGAE
jgi:4-hydroxy-2-oxoheptanedioate aldolase